MDNPIQVTRTKIIIPRRREEILTRQRLINAVTDAIENKLFIIAAPAGYGKTSLLIDAVHRIDLPVCWYSLDALDKDAFRFLSHFISCIRQRFPSVGKPSLTALQANTQGQININTLSTILINEIYEKITEHFVIVVDDYHLVDKNKTIDNFFNRFIQDVDENCHIIIASRHLLTLADLPLMVARSQVSGLGFEDLAFQPEEIIQLFRKNYNQEISESQADDLVNQTEGWITGLLLSSQLRNRENGVQGRVSRVTGVGLYEYMAQQILDQQPEAIQTFLLRTSIFEEFDSQLCQEVIGSLMPEEQFDWDQLVNFVLHHNLFVLPVGEERVYLRYHHLFRDFLRDCYHRKSPNEAKSIKLALARHYIEAGDWEPAYEIYRNLGELEQLAALIERAGTSLISSGKIMTLSDWLNGFPDTLLEKRPVLLSLAGSVSVMRGETSKGILYLKQAIKSFDLTTPSAHLIRTYIRCANANRLSGNFDQAEQDVDTALSLLQQDNFDRSLYADACRAKGVNYYQLGNLQLALEWMDKSYSSYQSIRDTRSAAYVAMEIGLINKAMGNYPAAEEAYSKALDYFNQTGNSIGQANLYNNLGVLQQLLGEYDQAASSLEKAIQYARLSGYTRLEAYGMASIADLYRELDATEESLAAYSLAEKLALQINDRFLRLYITLAQARLLCGNGQFIEAQACLEKAEKMIPSEGVEYEKNLIVIEKSLLFLLWSNYSFNLDAVEDSTNYFLSHKYQVEAFRSVILAGFVIYKARNHQLSEPYFQKAKDLLNNQENWHSFIVAAREIKGLLLDIKGVTDEMIEFFHELATKIEQFEGKLSAIRKQIRRRTTAIPFAPPKIVIRALGKVQVKLSDHVVTSSEWQTQTAKELFFLLFAHPDGLTKEQIGEIFWPESSPSELKLRFKNTIYRVRHAVGKDAIILKDNYYYFNYDLDYEYDVDQFYRELNNAKQAETDEKKLQHFRTAIKSYKGSYLPDIEANWVTLEREKISLAFQTAALECGEILFSQNEYEECLIYCQKALEENPCLEEAHRLVMRVYATMGDQRLLFRQYENCVNALREELGAEPSDQTKNLFESLRKQ